MVKVLLIRCNGSMQEESKIAPMIFFNWINGGITEVRTLMVYNGSCGKMIRSH